MVSQSSYVFVLKYERARVNRVTLMELGVTMFVEFFIFTKRLSLITISTLTKAEIFINKS